MPFLNPNTPKKSVQHGKSKERGFVFNTQQIKTFCETAKFRSFTEAAQALYISQPALTKQIASLEKELGLSLFERNHAGVVLTKSGEIMRDCFDRYAKDIEQSRLLALKAGESEYLSVGLLMGMDFHRALEHFRIFRLDHPGVNLYSAGSDELKEDVLSGKSNAALLFDNHLENLKGFEHMPLYPSRFVYVLSHEHPLAARKELLARDIAAYEFIFSNSGRIEDQGIFGHIARAAQNLGIRREQVRFCRNFESIFVEVAAGQVMTLMDEYVSFLNDQYVTIPTGLGHNVVVAWKSGANTPALDQLLTYLKQKL